MMQSLEYYYDRYWIEKGDPRTQNSPILGGGPWQMLSLVGFYLVTVTIIGPYVMRKRKPVENLIWPMRIYNGFMVVFNAYLYLGHSSIINWGLDCWGCGKSMQWVPTMYWWEMTLLSRYFDFFDSIFFVLRKKFDHLSLLHVLHHSLVPIIVWFAGKLEPTPMIVFAGYINLPIHVIMYSYYCLSTFPNLRKYLWWKKYITTIQIIQFAIDLVHSLQVIYLPNCNYHWLTYLQTAFSLTFIYLFGMFYIKNYRKQQQQKQERDRCSTTDLTTQESPSLLTNGRSINNNKDATNNNSISKNSINHNHNNVHKRQTVSDMKKSN